MTTRQFTTRLTSLLILTVMLTLSLTLTSCVTSTTPEFVIDDSQQSVGKSERIKFIVLHYTAENDAESLRLLTTGNVSSHYLIPADNSDRIYHLVPDHERAWHAGQSYFAGRSILNDTSIGIEIVNEGIAKQYLNATNDDNNGYHPYDHYVAYQELQIQKVVQLLQNLIKKYNIEAKNIVAHSDIAPSRKLDPGAKFPWYRLYKEYGIGAWYDEADKLAFMNQQAFDAETVVTIKQQFRQYGYHINNSDEWDRESQNVVYAFQLHFRPQHLTGKVDLETYAILKALNKKYADTH